MQIRTLARSIQVFLPFLPALQEALFTTRLLWQRWSGRPIDPDLLAVEQLGLGPGDLIVDVGANRGFVLDALLRLTRGTRIVAFEPNPRLAAALERRYRHEPRAEIRALGLGDASANLTLWLPVYRDWPFEGLASLDPDKAAGWLAADRLYGFRPEHLRLEPLSCEIVRLDDLDLAPAFIKLDVQGHELAVLRGAEATLRRHRPVLLMEEADEPSETGFLAELGYVVASFERGRFVPGRRGRHNSFFLPSERVARLDRLASSRSGRE